jgi:hypothetical protein
MDWLKFFYGLVGVKYPIGSAIVVFLVSGLLFTLLWVAIGIQYNKDHPVKPPPHGKEWVILKVISPMVVDQELIHGAFRQFGMNWPTVEIQWPDSADQLLDVLRRALKQFDKDAATLVGAGEFAKKVPSILDRISEDRRRAEVTIPAMVQRIRNLEERYRVDAVTSFLLYANIRIHQDANFYASWEGLSRLGLEVPAVWVTLRANPIAVALGKPEGKLINAELNVVSGVTISSISGSPGLTIQLPKHPQEMLRNEMYWWALPQLEYASEVVRGLPDAYSEDWRFSRAGF